MLFNSTQYLIFLPLVLLVYYVIPNRLRYLWLLAASYYFYMCWNAKYALLMLFSTFTTYLCALGIERIKSAGYADEKSARLKELNIPLNMDQKDKTLMDDAPEQDSPDKEKSRSVER